MDMDQEAIPGAAQGDLADVVARASAMAALPSTSHGHHLQPPPPSSPAPAAADHMPASASSMADQILRNPYYEEDRRHAAVMFETAPSTVDPYLSSSVTAPRGGYWLPPQPLPVQISQQHACDGGRDTVMMTGAAAAGVEGEDAMRSSSLTPAVAGHQMMKRKNDVKKVVCIPAPPSTMNNRPSGGEVIPSDLWAWRKYGQKPIKGSPYPRYVLDQHHGKGNHKAMSILDDGMLQGYYRCSSSKGCMARKQVERSRSDPNMLVITYTAEHNHPWPMQRNVLAGYSRPHTNVSTGCKKKNSCRVENPTSSSLSPPSRNIEHNVVASGDIEYQQSTNIMESVCPMGALGTEGVVPATGNCIQPVDEVFTELEELESTSNNPVSSNVYSRGVGYEWNNF